MDLTVYTGFHQTSRYAPFFVLRFSRLSLVY